MIGREQRLRVWNAGFDPEQTRARRLQLDVIAGPKLCAVTLHQFDPALELCANVESNAHLVPRFGRGRDRVCEVMCYCVRRQIAQFRDTAVTRQSGSVPAEMADDCVVRMLIGGCNRTKQDVRPDDTDAPGDLERIRNRTSNMGVAAQVAKIQPCRKQFRSVASFRFALFGRAVCPRLTARAHSEEQLAPARRFRHQNPAARELNVVGMRADRQDAAGFRFRGHMRGQIRRFRRG